MQQSVTQRAPPDFDPPPLHVANARPSPPRWAKHELYNDPEIFKQIDDHAIEVSKVNHRCFRDLIFNLFFVRKTSEIDRLRIIFRWMTVKNMQNIRFDNSTPGSPEELLTNFKQRKVTYSKIFELMCQYAQIPCFLITGMAKGVEYRPGVTISHYHTGAEIAKTAQFNHSWNAVFVDSAWQLLDTQWGTRYLSTANFSNQDENLVYEYDDFYFLASPSHLIYSHYPDDPIWQLLEPSLPFETFASLPMTKAFFFKSELQFWSHHNGVLELDDGTLKLTLGWQRPVGFTFKVCEAETMSSEYRGVPLSRYVIQEVCDGTVNYYFRAPFAGAFYFTVFTQNADDVAAGKHNVFNAACEYRLVARRAADNTTPFADEDSTYGYGPSLHMQQFGLIPMAKQGIIQTINNEAEIQLQKTKAGKVHFRLRALDGSAADQFLHQKDVDTGAICSLRLPREVVDKRRAKLGTGEYVAEVYANSPADGNQFTHVAQYLIVNGSPKVPDYEPSGVPVTEPVGLAQYKDRSESERFISAPQSMPLQESAPRVSLAEEQRNAPRVDYMQGPRPYVQPSDRDMGSPATRKKGSDVSHGSRDGRNSPASQDGRTSKHGSADSNHGRDSPSLSKGRSQHGPSGYYASGDGGYAPADGQRDSRSGPGGARGSGSGKGEPGYGQRGSGQGGPGEQLYAQQQTGPGSNNAPGYGPGQGKAGPGQEGMYGQQQAGPGSNNAPRGYGPGQEDMYGQQPGPGVNTTPHGYGPGQSKGGPVQEVMYGQQAGPGSNNAAPGYGPGQGKTGGPNDPSYRQGGPGYGQQPGQGDPRYAGERSGYGSNGRNSPAGYGAPGYGQGDAGSAQGDPRYGARKAGPGSQGRNSPAGGRDSPSYRASPNTARRDPHAAGQGRGGQPGHDDVDSDEDMHAAGMQRAVVVHAEMAPQQQLASDLIIPSKGKQADRFPPPPASWDEDDDGRQIRVRAGHSSPKTGPGDRDAARAAANRAIQGQVSQEELYPRSFSLKGTTFKPAAAPKNFDPSAIRIQEEESLVPAEEQQFAEEAAPRRYAEHKEIFRDVDKFAYEVSQYDHKTFRDFIWDLIHSRNITNELEKCRVLFLWLCTKDLSKINFSQVNPGTPEEILMGLKKGTNTYAIVFEVLCSFSGLKCVCVSGYAKGADYQPGMKFHQNEATHSWNAVQISGIWRLIDCHWAARRMVGKKSLDNIRYELDEFYFMTDPRQLIYTHFPHHANWQLLKTRLHQDEFEALPPVKSLFFRYNLQLTNCNRAVLECQGDMTVELSFAHYTGPGLEFTFSLLTDTGAEEVQGKKLSLFGFHSIVAKHSALFHLRFPLSGAYKLVVYTRERTPGATQNEGTYSAVCEWKLVSGRAAVNSSPYPKCSGHLWGPPPVDNKYGLEARETEAVVYTRNGLAELSFLMSKKLLFMAKLRCNQYSDAVLSECVLMRTIGETAVFGISVPGKGEYGLDIYVNDPTTEGKTLFWLCQYLILCEEATVCAVRYPSVPTAYLGPQPGFADLGMTARSHRDPFVVSHTGDVEITFSLQNTALRATANLIFSTTNEDLSDYVLQQMGKDDRGDSVLSFHIRLPREGVYKLQVYAQPLSRPSDTLPGVYNYVIQTTVVSRLAVPYPKQFSQWKEGCFLHTPQQLQLKEFPVNVPFHLSIPAANKVAVVAGEAWHHLQQSSDTDWKGDVSILNDERLAVCVNYGSDPTSYNTLLEYSL